MDTIRKLTTQLTQIWNGWNRRQQVGFSAVGILCVVACAVVLNWASQKEFVTLIDSLSPAEGHDVVAALESQEIEYRLNFSGSAVSVPLTDISIARLAIKDLGHEVNEQDGGFGSGLWSDPAQQLAQQQRALERRLATSIKQFRSVRSATVHISRGKDSPFVRDRTPSKASVVLQMVPGTVFTSSDSQAIVSLVSHSVENLAPEHTMIVDTQGHLLSEGDNIGADVNGQLEYRRALEQNLASKAEGMLATLLGPGRAAVRVSADIDFKEQTTATTTYDPETKVKTRESISSETTPGRAVGGVAGAAGNVTPPATTPIGSDVETIETEYQNSETIETTSISPGKIVRLTVAAVVEISDEPTGAGAGGGAGQSVTKEQIEKIIQQAVGFDSTRNDQIEVVVGDLVGAPDLAVGTDWMTTLESLTPFVMNASLGIASLVALVIALTFLRKLKPVVVEVNSRNSLDPEMQMQLTELSDQIRQNPEALSAIFASWLQNEREETEGTARNLRKSA